MHSLKQEFIYVQNKTLSGNRIIAGIREYNSYILIKKDYEKSFFSLLEKLKNSSKLETLTAKEKDIYDSFSYKGFLEGDECVSNSFNEYDVFVKKIFEQKIRSTMNKGYSELKKYIFSLVYTFLFIVGIAYIFICYEQFMVIRLNVNEFTPLEILVCVLVFPVIIDFMHEFSHFLAAKMIGVEVDKVVVGFFITWPTIFLEYKGLNLYKTWEKVFVASAGIVIHLANVLIGILIYSMGYDYILLIVWVIANMSMAVSNLMFLGPTDGYFILSSLLGIYNFRYIGYKTLKYFFYKKGKKPNKYGYICGCILVALWGESFIGIYLACKYYSFIFNLAGRYNDFFSLLLIVFLIFRFIYRIKKV